MTGIGGGDRLGGQVRTGEGDRWGGQVRRRQVRETGEGDR